MNYTSHLICAHTLWRSFIQPGDQVVDATLGNGHDTLALAKMLHGNGHLIGYDIQEKALLTTQQRLEQELSIKEKKILIELRQECHSHLSASQPKLIVYNLGYLPGSDKSLTTEPVTTLLSIKKAQELLLPGGMISITLYPGHATGQEEHTLLLEYTKSLNKKEWHSCWIQWPNRTKGPSLLLFQKMDRPPAS